MFKLQHKTVIVLYLLICCMSDLKIHRLMADVYLFVLGITLTRIAWLCSGQETILIVWQVP